MHRHNILMEEERKMEAELQENMSTFRGIAVHRNGTVYTCISFRTNQAPEFTKENETILKKY